MEINITKFFTENAAPMDYSASVAEIGQNAGRDTWDAAKEDAGLLRGCLRLNWAKFISLD